MLEDGLRLMQHVRDTIRELRRYIDQMECREGLEETDTLLSVALLEIERSLARARSTTNPADPQDKP
jgi:hypothetical protein